MKHVELQDLKLTEQQKDALQMVHQALNMIAVTVKGLQSEGVLVSFISNLTVVESFEQEILALSNPNIHFNQAHVIASTKALIKIAGTLTGLRHALGELEELEDYDNRTTGQILRMESSHFYSVMDSSIKAIGNTKHHLNEAITEQEEKRSKTGSVLSALEAFFGAQKGGSHE